MLLIDNVANVGMRARYLLEANQGLIYNDKVIIKLARDRQWQLRILGGRANA